VGNAVAAALVDHCGARFAVDWHRTGVLVGQDGHEVDVDSLIGSVVDEESADLLVALLQGEGVPTWEPLDGSAPTHSTDRDPVVLAVATCVSWRRMRMVAVSDCGLIVKRVGLVEGCAAAFRHRSADGYRTGMLLVASTPVDALLSDRRATLLPWDRIESATLSRSRFKMAADGRTRRFKVVRACVTGDLVGSLERHLGGRLTLRS
jgi:hypothetical protein